MVTGDGVKFWGNSHDISILVHKMLKHEIRDKLWLITRTKGSTRKKCVIKATVVLRQIPQVILNATKHFELHELLI